MLHFTERVLSSKAEALVQFDTDSIRQVALARSGKLPELWLVDPDLYESGGRILRDSTTARLLAYSSETQTLYVTDGCNSCTHAGIDLAALNATQIQDFSRQHSLRPELLEKLAAAIR